MAYHGQHSYGWHRAPEGYQPDPYAHWRQNSASSSRGREESRTLLWVSRVPRRMRAADLAQIFERFGPLVRIEIPPAKEADYSYVFAYVQFEDPQDAATAVQRMNGAYIGRHSIRPLIVEWSNNSSYMHSAEQRRPRSASRRPSPSPRRNKDRRGSIEDRQGRGRSRGHTGSRDTAEDYDYGRRRQQDSRSPPPRRQQRSRTRSRSPYPRAARRYRSPSSSPRRADPSSAISPSPQLYQQHPSSQEMLDRLRWTPSPVRGGSGERAGRGKREDMGQEEDEDKIRQRGQQQDQQEQQPARRSRWDENEQDWEERRQRGQGGKGEGGSNGWRPQGGKKPQQHREAREQCRRPIDSPEPATGITIRGSSSAGESNGRAGSSKGQKRFKREQGEGDGRCRL